MLSKISDISSKISYLPKGTIYYMLYKISNTIRFITLYIAYKILLSISDRFVYTSG